MSGRSRAGAGATASIAAGALLLTSAAALALARVPGPHPHRALAATAVTVAVFPSPGSHFVMPAAQIAFRGLPASDLGTITVTGSQSGTHTGRLAADSDGQGASFLPAKQFTAGEVVTVRTSLHILGSRNGSFAFTIAQPAGAIPNVPLPFAARVPGDVQAFQSRPDLAPAAVSVSRTDGGSGDVFLAPQQGPVQDGTMILDSRGRLIWFKALPAKTLAADFRVQTYKGKPVLTWWQGYLGAGIGVGAGEIYDDSYKRVAEVKAANGLGADLHEFELTARGTALITVYSPVWIGPPLLPRRSIVLDSIVQEIDIATGLVLFQWDSLDHVALRDSLTAMPKSATSPFDYFHINAAREDSDGSVIISARNTWAAYKVDHRSGAVIWTLGGKHSSFTLAANAVFAFQHDVRMLGSGDRYVTIFDDGAGPPAVHKQSRLIELKLDLTHRTASLVFERNHSPSLLAVFEGSYQQLAGGSAFAGWGQQPYFTQYDSRGRLVLDGRFIGQIANYRAYRFNWSGQPGSAPAIAFAGGSSPHAYASWNGATSVARWTVLGGTSSNLLSPLTSAPRSDFETPIALKSVPRYLAVEALSRSGKVLARSRVIKTG